MAYQVEVVDLQTLPPAQTVLSAQELAFYNALKVPKRKTEWLGGRLALKKLLCAKLGGAWTDYTVLAPGGVGKPTVRAGGKPDEGVSTKFSALFPSPLEVFRALCLFRLRPWREKVAARPDEGVYKELPLWRGCRTGEGGTNPAELIDISFSLTHSNGYAVAALAPEGTHIGIDLEKITPRLNAWKDQFFHPSELASQPLCDAFLTSLWTQKEALVKLLGSGLTVNTLDVRVVGGQPVLSGRALEIYASLGAPQITLETRTLIPGFCFSVACTAPVVCAPLPVCR